MSTAESQPRSEHRPFLAVVMGVSGSGKSSVGERLAAMFHAAFIEGDQLHPKTNVEKMAHGHPLTDEDRWPWLAVIGARLAAARGEGRSLIVSCSALKRSYRDRLRDAAGPGLMFIHLEGDFDLLAGRMQERKGHFMPPSLLRSQIETLEDPRGEPGVLVVSVAGARAAVVARAAAALDAALR